MYDQEHPDMDPIEVIHSNIAGYIVVKLSILMWRSLPEKRGRRISPWVLFRIVVIIDQRVLWLLVFTLMMDLCSFLSLQFIKKSVGAYMGHISFSYVGGTVHPLWGHPIILKSHVNEPYPHFYGSYNSSC